VSAQARRYYERGKQALDVGDYETAQQDLASALQLAPAFGNAVCAYAVALAKGGDAPRAAAVLRSGIPRARSRVSAAAMNATLGDVLVLAGDFFAAEDAFNAAAAVPGFEARVASGLARVYSRLGRYRDMALALERAALVSKPAASRDENSR
jgi:tetratricopeptide (TPR) repeat protein